MVFTGEMLSGPAPIYLGVRKMHQYSRVTLQVFPGLTLGFPCFETVLLSRSIMS